jgi:hypothetical protein
MAQDVTEEITLAVERQASLGVDLQSVLKDAPVFLMPGIGLDLDFEDFRDIGGVHLPPVRDHEDHLPFSLSLCGLSLD